MSAAPRPIVPELAKLDLVLETPRLRLRPPVEADVEDMWPVVSDPAFPRMMSWAAHRERGETLEFLRRTARARAENTGASWAIELDGRVIGNVGLDGITFALRAWRVDRAELGYWIAPAHQGRGLVTEAADAVVRFGFQTLGLHKITVGCFSENLASRRVIEKLGFRFVGELEEDIWRDGAWHAQLRFEMTAPEWPDVHTTMRMQAPRPGELRRAPAGDVEQPAPAGAA